MAVLNKDLYGKMLNGRVGYILDVNKVNTYGGDLETFLNSCVSSVEFCLTYHNETKNYIDKNEVRFLTFLSYITYVPYGNLGYKKLEKFLSKKGINKSVADLRIEKFLNIMEEKLIDNISKEEMDYIKRFFNEYKKESFNLKDNLDITMLVCNVNNEIEANYGSVGFTDLLNVKKILNEYCYEIANSKEERDVLNINEILLKIPKKENLDEEELKHLLSYFNLTI